MFSLVALDRPQGAVNVPEFTLEESPISGLGLGDVVLPNPVQYVLICTSQGLSKCHCGCGANIPTPSTCKSSCLNCYEFIYPTDDDRVILNHLVVDHSIIILVMKLTFLLIWHH